LQHSRHGIWGTPKCLKVLPMCPEWSVTYVPEWALISLFSSALPGLSRNLSQSLSPARANPFQVWWRSICALHVFC